MKEKVLSYAVQVFGNQDTAQQWLNRENPMLGNKKPIDLLNTDQGCGLVLDILGRIEEGVYS